MAKKSFQEAIEYLLAYTGDQEFSLPIADVPYEPVITEEIVFPKRDHRVRKVRTNKIKDKLEFYARHEIRNEASQSLARKAKQLQSKAYTRGR